MTPGARAVLRIKLAQSALESTASMLRLLTRANNAAPPGKSRSETIRHLRVEVDRWDRELADALRSAEELP